MYIFNQDDLDACMKGDRKFICTEENKHFDSLDEFDKAWNQEHPWKDPPYKEINPNIIQGNKTPLLRSMHIMQESIKKQMEFEIQKSTNKIKEKYKENTEWFEQEVKRLESEIYLNKYYKKKGLKLTLSEEPLAPLELPQPDQLPNASDP